MPSDKRFPNLSGDPALAVAELEQVYDHVIGIVDTFTGWYRDKKGSKRLWGWTLRAGMIVATAIAGLIPVLAEIDKEGRYIVSPAWSTVFLGLAALFLALDRFAGFTSGWVRFMLAELELTRVKDAFLFDWQSMRLAWNAQTPTHEQAVEMVARAKAFAMECRNIVDEETKQWAVEFQTALRELEQAAKAAEVKKPAAINVRVSNGDKTSGGWRLKLNGGSERQCSGLTATVSSLAAGTHTLQASGTIGGQPVTAEKSVAVEAGAIVEVELVLA